MRLVSSMGTDNAFAELGLRPGATETEVKAAWRRLVSQWHPDRNDSSSAVAKMQRINQALKEIRLSGFRADPDLPGVDQPAPAGPGDVQEDHDRSGRDPFDDIGKAHTNEFDDDAGTDRQGRTISRKVKLTLEEAAVGCTKVLRGKVTDNCPSCEGTGYRGPKKTCRQCEGSGAVRHHAWYGWVSTLAECGACGGDGIVRQPCQACHGAGTLGTRRYKVTVRIPHGVRNGDLLRVDGRRAGTCPRPGDLDIRVEVLNHEFFELDDDGTVRCEIPVDGFAWIANRSIEVPTLSGLQTMQLSRNQLSYHLMGQGFPVERRGRRGDYWVRIVPTFPERLSTDQEILLNHLMATDIDGQGSNNRLCVWNQAMRTWKRGLLRRGR
jgi:molecular chaperone DnaJ